MTETADLKGYLEDIARKYSGVVFPKLNEGSLVPKGFGSYEIDDLEICKTLGDFPEGAVPIGPIYRALKSSQSEIRRLSDGKKIIPFSKMFKARLGECLEKSILVQLSAQKARDSFLVIGALEIDEEVGADPHAYNVIFKDGKPFLVDVENPIEIDGEGNVIRPYIAPVLGVEGDHGRIIVSDEWRKGRTYCLS